MTADFYRFEISFLGAMARRIIDEVWSVNSVAYNVTSKPQGDD